MQLINLLFRYEAAYLLRFSVSLCFILCPILSAGQTRDTLVLRNKKTTFINYNHILFFEDKTNQKDIQQVRTEHFFTNKNRVPNFGFSNYTYWLELSLLNKTQSSHYLLRISNPNLDSVTLFYINRSGQTDYNISGTEVNYEERNYKTRDLLFDLYIPTDSAETIFLKIRSKSQLIIPISVGPSKYIAYDIYRDSNILSLFFGLLIIMIIYNLFLYISTLDKNYILYVIYLITIGFTQICLQGIGYQFIWHNSPFLTNQSILWSGVLSGIFTGIFSKFFLSLSQNLPFFNKLINILILLDVIAFILSLLSLYYYSYQIVNFVASVGCLIILMAALKLVFRGNRPAIFFFLAYSFFLLSVILYVVWTYGYLGYNFFTSNLLLIGTTIEIALLSFALADKINEYRREKDRAHLAVLQAVREKEEYVRQENVVLEAKVQQRTVDLERSNTRLQKSNTELNTALTNLKKAETQLVHAEKMASLGQLTAGIAHEINNPINFVKSNVQPLKRDLDDLSALISKYQQINKDNLEEKLQEIRHFIAEIDLDILEEEIPSLIAGIEEGADRTIEIVKGLREFSRSDENVIKKTDVHIGIESTLRLLKRIIPNNIVVKKEYGELPLIEGYPGQLNQVFVNLLTNAAQAMEETSNEENQYITIKTISENEHVAIHISDTGPGIPEEVKSKIFDPFFTTKDVGKGTGLGLSIVYSIVERHGGSIKVVSEKEKGTEFIITLPIKQPFPEESEG